MKFADIILPLALPRNYTYSIPREMEQAVVPGCRVAVQFGKNKKYAAIVKAIHENAPAAYQTKPLLYLLDEAPIVYPIQLSFWQWIARYYMCTEGDVMNAALPAHLKLTSETRLVFNLGYGEDLTELSEEEFLVAEALQIRQELTIDEVQQIVDKLQVYALVKQLLDKKVCFVYEELKEAYRPKEERVVTLHPRCEDEQVLAAVFEEVQRAPKQMEALLGFLHLHKTQGLVRQADLQKKAGVSSAVVKALADKNILVIQKQAVDRIPMTKGEITVEFSFNEEQEAGYRQIKKQFEDKQTVLLHGVTSSGKTMLYIKLIEAFLRQDKQVLYLLPEIALTAQIVRRLQKHFGDQIGIYHSKFNNNERVEIWNKVKSGAYRVILGARSSLLLPFKELGLIILDEEHDASYKQQDPAPRYHARDAAVYYAGLFDAKVLLGSATPSLESFYNAQTGKYGLVQLAGRYGGMKMPDIEIVDMKRVPRDKQTVAAYLSPVLKESMKASLAENKQIILFQNRRGYAPMIVCATCGWIPHCNDCDVSLTYHKYHHRLHCHYCGHQYPVPDVCPACGSTKLINRSFGTERIEDDLVTFFPQARIARMDLDAVRNKDAHHKLIALFEQKRIDVLVGTQMVVKGLDFDHVTLVGILSADNLLSYPDFRVHERAFQLMEQVSGRAGRRDERGKVIIQTENTTHPVLDFVMRHDYTGFYKRELAERERFSYPPFSRLIRLVLKHKKPEVVREAATVLGNALQPLFGDRLLGPSAPPVSRVRSYYLMELLIKLPRHSKKIDQAKALIIEKINWLQTQPDFRRVFVTPDVDCV
ncbi:MAG TPA: primosomal protein N' [Chitinophagaceae bacterium]|nr:primosomal protein N' [Chitinophagaceae bacterium]